MEDYSHYIDRIYESWDTVLRASMDFEDKKPVILIDMQSAKVYAYPYKEFRADLSPRSQVALRKQYERALKKEQVVVFVRDNKKRKLISASFPLVGNTL